MDTSISKDLHDQFQEALNKQSNTTNPFFTCPLCQKCPVCSLNSRKRFDGEINEPLSMPANWTQSFTSPRRHKATKSAPRPLPREDSTVSLTPKQNSKYVKLIETVEEKQRLIESLEKKLEESQTDLNLMVNRLKYANIDIKNGKTKLFQKEREMIELNDQSRRLEDELRKSQINLDECRKCLATSESCRSNTTQELSRYRQENRRLMEQIREIKNNKHNAKENADVNVKGTNQVKHDLEQLLGQLSDWEADESGSNEFFHVIRRLHEIKDGL